MSTLSLGTGGFLDLTDYLINGYTNNGTTAVLGADTVGNADGFSAGRSCGSACECASE